MTTLQSQKVTPSLAVEERVDALLQAMTLAEKIGQMTQVEKNSLTPEDVTTYYIGSVLSGGGGNPSPNTPDTWEAMVRGFAEAALKTRLKIPLIYGSDAVHGHNNVKGAVIFPHNIGLGAAGDETLTHEVARITAREMLATNVHWNFAPAVTVPQDIRWGRTYEGYSENSDLVTRLGSAHIRGLQANERPVLASVKHFLADGGKSWDTVSKEEGISENWQSATTGYMLDQGDTRMDEATLRAVHLAPYRAAIEAGALNIMVSHSSWNGVKILASRYLLTDVLKGELGFTGFLVSDWHSVNQVHPDYYTAVVTSINAGLDMSMVPFDYQEFIETLTLAVEKGDVSIERINDAVRRILRAKFWLGLFEKPFGDPELLAAVGSSEHRALAREAVRKTLVLLKNNAALPLPKTANRILLAGSGADDIGMLCGGWTIEWQGSCGAITPGTTFLEAVCQAVSANTQVEYQLAGEFEGSAPFGIVVVGEKPYAEGVGDSTNLTLSDEDRAAIRKTRQHCEKLIVILLSGRPLVITDQLDLADAWVAAWLPGTEAQGITDVLFGDYPFAGKLPYTWPRSMDQLPLIALPAHSEPPLFPFGYGL